jgi:hypothetical protein
MEADAAVTELNNFKQKYREENRRLNESLGDVQRLNHELVVLNGKLDTQLEKMKEMYGFWFLSSLLVPPVPSRSLLFPPVPSRFLPFPPDSSRSLPFPPVPSPFPPVPSRSLPLPPVPLFPSVHPSANSLRAQQHAIEIQKLDTERRTEQNQHQEEVGKLKDLIRSERAMAKTKFEQMEEEFETSRNDDRVRMKVWRDEEEGER